MLEKTEQTDAKINDFLEIQSSYAPSFSSIDDSTVLQTVLKKYPDFTADKDEKTLRKIFLDVLEDVVFVSKLLEYYSIGIDNFIKIVFRNYGEIFNSAIFLKKIRKTITEKNYDCSDEL